MTIHLINAHRIDVPEGVKVVDNVRGAGAYDWLEHGGFHICTFEQESPEVVVEDGLYIGPFIAWPSGWSYPEVEAKTLGELMVKIDGYREYGKVS